MKSTCSTDWKHYPRLLRQSRHRRPLPEHVSREIHHLEPEESCCPECGGELDYSGEISVFLPGKAYYLTVIFIPMINKSAMRAFLI
ncbi:hypothetical protein DQF07_19445 [Shigella flexneri]|nr:hypothetical protein [Shigella flexneri]